MTETNINKELNPASGFVTEEENPAFTAEQIEEYGLDKQEEQAQEPELILGKFKNTDALQDAYRELEKKFHEKSNVKGRDEVSSKEEGNEHEEKPTEDADEQAPEASTESTETTQSAVNEAFELLADAGELNDSVVEAFNKAGISEELIQHYQELAEFKQEYELKSIMSEVGSEEDYNSLMSWAANNLEQKEIDMFNNIVDKGSPDDIRLAVKNLQAKQGGNTPAQEPQANLVKADAVASIEAGYSSQSEMLNDMADERYATDEKFREAVMRKVSKSAF